MSTVDERDLLDQSQYLASRIYDDPGSEPISLDIFSACAIGNYDCVQDAINSGQDINTRNKAGWTPLMYAAYVGHDTIVNLLLDSDANPSLGTPSNLTPLMVAAGCGNESVCYFLIQADAEIDAQDSNGFTALLYAVRQGHQTVVQLLLETGADLTLTENEKQSTALMMAALEGDEIIVDILIACGADMNAKDKDGHTARSLAYNKHHVRTVTLLDNAVFIYRRMSGSSSTLEPPPYENDEREGVEQEVGGEGEEFDESGDLFSGAKEFESFKQVQSIKKKIQFNLGRRSGPRWSLPFGRRSSGSILMGLGGDESGDFLTVKQKRLRPAISMPERANPPQIEEEEEEPEATVDEKLAALLRQLDLEKYIDVFQQQEIDFDSFLTFNDEDLKRIGIKLMGPRRKLSLAISEVKKQQEEDGGEGERGPGGGREGEGERERCGDTEKVGGGGGGGREGDGRTGRKTSRPPLIKQPSTELTAAYRQALETIEILEKQLSQEHQLRKAADSYLLKLQTARQHTVGCMDSVKDAQHSVKKHCKAVRSTHGRISGEMETLRLLTTSTVVDPKQLHKIYSEVVSLCAKMGLELEALSRSVSSANENIDTLAYHLDAKS